MKKTALTLAALLIMTVSVLADEGITVYSNGNLVADKGIIVEGRTLVPVRGVFEYMDYNVEWDSDTKTATLTNTKKGIVITLTDGSDTFIVNDTVITPEIPQQIVDGRFMLPLRAVGEAVGARINWNSETKTVTINPNNQLIEITQIDEDDPIIDENNLNVLEN